MDASPYSHAFKMDLIEAYRLLGLGKAALNLFMALGVKYIQVGMMLMMIVMMMMMMVMMMMMMIMVMMIIMIHDMIFTGEYIIRDSLDPDVEEQGKLTTITSVYYYHYHFYK